MRTKALKDLTTRLISIDDDFNHSRFLNEQFLIDHQSEVDRSPKSFSRDFYASNKYSKRFNYTLNKTMELMARHRSFSYSADYVFIYAAFELYVQSLLEMATRISLEPDLGAKVIPRDAMTRSIEDIFRILGSSMDAAFTNDEVQTINYLRLRRNCIVHADGRISTALVELIRNYGHALNRYWRKELSKPVALDFSKKSLHKVDRNMASFVEEEIVDVIRVVRQLGTKIDEKVLALISQERLLKLLLKEFDLTMATLDIKSKTRKQVESKFAYFALVTFGIERQDINFKSIDLLASHRCES
jgi:hypothetical protein